MLNPITYTEQVVSDFLRYQLSTYAFADQSLYDQMRALLNLEQTRATPLLKGPYISLSRTFRQGATIDQLISEGLLHPHIHQLSPYPSLYGHQEQAIRAIRAGHTTLVATGTGSGKTECFLFPIISRCLELRDAGEPAGITAVIVYPMNALAEDQLQRMRELLAGTGVTFGMYVGKTPDSESNITGQRLPAGSSVADYRVKLAEMQRKKLDVAVHPPEERVSREEMRRPGKQPRILLTNIKQLELLLTRQKDLELFDNALLEFMVFDEAHTFSGAQGAETACLIRRLRAYCGKNESSTTCIATSATIADPVNGLEAGRIFASRFFGVDGATVELVGETYETDIWGESRTASGPLSGDQGVQLQTLLDVLSRVDRDNAAEGDIQALRIWFQSVTGSRLADGDWRQALHIWLSHNEVVYQISEKLRRPHALEDLLEELTTTLGRAISEEEILIWLALGAASRQDTRPLLRPVVHGFVRGVSGAVVTFPEPTQEARLWLSAEDALAGNEEMHRFPVLSCNTCGQHYFEHSLEDFLFTGREPGGGIAEGADRYWRPLERANGGTRAVSLNHQVGSDPDDDAPARTQTLYVCRYCGAVHDKDVAQCLGCGREKIFAPLHFVQQRDDHQGELTNCVSCGAHGRRFVGQYREPARPVRATTVADVHVLAQSMIHRAERRRLLVFADNRQDAAFQAGWMQDRSRRYRLRELLYKKITGGKISVGDLTLWLDQLLDSDDELSRALIPEVWRVEAKTGTGQAHGLERKWFLRAQIVRELAIGARQRIGLEPWGRLKVEYQGLVPDLPVILKWANRIGCKAEALVEGVASLLDSARARKILHDNVTKVFSRFWLDGAKELQRGYIAIMKDVPKGLVFQREGDNDDKRLTQWFSAYDTAVKQAAVSWGVIPDEVEAFLRDIWELLTREVDLLIPVTLLGGRGNPLPRCTGAHQVDVDKLLLTPHKGRYRCDTCRRLHIRTNPANSCMAFRCSGVLRWEDEDKDNYDLLLLDQEFSMLRAREHSAQIPGPERERIEIAFKSDNERINTLVCTPTLELGVNIGALDAVLMRNMPPLPANYWQRAGRAGRQFRMALDITYCRAASHDRSYFNEPLKMLEGLVEPPSFNLRNPVMIRKHAFATILTTLFKLVRDEALPPAELEAIKDALHSCLPRIIKAWLFTNEGYVRPIPLDVSAVGLVVQTHRERLLLSVMTAFEQGWPVEDLEVITSEQMAAVIDGFGNSLQEVVNRLFSRLQWALGQLERLRKVAANKGTLDADEEAQRARCERLVKKLKGEAKRKSSQAEGVDDTNTYGVLAAEGFLPGYGLDTGAVTITHEAPRYGSDIQDWELRRNTSLAIREYIPGNLIYANGHKFVPRRFHLEPEEPLAFVVDMASESIQDGGASTGMSTLATQSLLGVAMCDVDAPHQSYISDEEDYRFQMPVAIFGHEQGRHGGGKAYDWGGAQLHLKRSVHMRLVNVGAAGRVRNQQLLGYPVCLVCGHSRSPMSHQAEIDQFSEQHRERCGRPIEFVGFYAEVVSDALVLVECNSREIAYSVLEALRQGAAEVLDMGITDLQILVFGKAGSEDVDGLLFDPMPGGSGLLDQIIKRWPEVVAAAKTIVTECATACESSCVDCLQHFRNSFYHNNLNRHVAMESFREWGDQLTGSHVIPSILPDESRVKQPVNDPEVQLKAMLEAAGLCGFETEKPIPISGGIVTRPDFYFHEPNEQFAGVCIYFDGMSSHIHGNSETASRDRMIREELRNKDYEVVEIMYQQLFDKVSMRSHMKKIAKAVMGITKAREIETNDSWFV
jgi:hypothetical protein